MNIRKFYLKRYPCEKLGKELNPITFARLYHALENGEGVYNTIGVCNSTVKENLFKELAHQLGVKFRVVNRLWEKNI